MTLRFSLASVFCAVIPDIDVIGFQFGIRYSDLLGHRGLTHSLAFALVLAVIVVLMLFRQPFGTQPTAGKKRRAQLALVGYFFVVTASHGLLDAMTDGGMGIAFFAPFDTTRYFLPWQPIVASPISAGHFFTGHGLIVLLSELQWVVLPAISLCVVAALVRRLFNRQHKRFQLQSPGISMPSRIMQGEEGDVAFRSASQD
jgi:inner membrane protein